MKTSTKDKIEGEKDKIKGHIKEGIGTLIGNSDLKEEGQNDQLKGKARKKMAEIEKVFDR